MFRTMEVSALERTCRLERHESDLIQYITPWWWTRVMQGISSVELAGSVLLRN